MSNEKRFELNFDFTEALRRFARTDPKELHDLAKKVKGEHAEIEQEIEEARDRTRQGARRTKHRFRL